MNVGVITGLVLLIVVTTLLFLLIRATRKSERLISEKEALEDENEVLKEMYQINVPDTHDDRINSMSEWGKK